MIDEKHIFEQKLKGKPIAVHTDQITYEEVRLLFKCGIISSINGHEESGHLVGRAAEHMQSYHCIEAEEGPDVEVHDIFPGRLVTFRHRETK